MLLHVQLSHLTALLNFIVGKYFASLSSMLIMYNSKEYDSTLQSAYLYGIETALKNLSTHGILIGLQWIDVNQMHIDEFEQKMLSAVNNTVTEGFISVLSNTTHFLHARYFATRNANIRLKDKLYLFLCEHESPTDLLAAQILQFYPNHLMIVPAFKHTTYNKPKKSTMLDKMTGRQREPMAKLKERTLDAYRDINFELWTQKFVGSVGNLNAIRLDVYLPNETFAKNAKLYANKLENLQGRTMLVGSVTYVPYTIANYVPAGTGNTDPINPKSPNLSIHYIGTEANIIKTFCQLHNCHLRVEAYGNDNWGSIYDNETGDGMMGDLYAQRVELAIGCIYNWYDGITETSHPIARSSVTILGPAPALYPAWRTTLMPFDGTTWFFLLCIMLLCAFVLHMLKYSKFFLNAAIQRSDFSHIEVLEKSILDIFALFIQQPSAPTTFVRLAPRIFLTALLFATITLENTYSGQLKSLLTVPLYSAPVDTVEKFAKSGWKWGVPSVIWITSIENSELTTEQTIVRNFEVRDYDFLYNGSFRNDYGLGIEGLMYGGFTIGKYITIPAVEQSIVLKDDLYFDWTRAVSVRGWVFMPMLNKHIRTCLETGLYSYWEMQLKRIYFSPKLLDMLQSSLSAHSHKAPPTALGIRNISGPLIFLLFGYILATIVFLLELFGQTLKKSIFKRNVN